MPQSMPSGRTTLLITAGVLAVVTVALLVRRARRRRHARSSAYPIEVDGESDVATQIRVLEHRGAQLEREEARAQQTEANSDAATTSTGLNLAPASGTPARPLPTTVIGFAAGAAAPPSPRSTPRAEPASGPSAASPNVSPDGKRLIYPPRGFTPEATDTPPNNATPVRLHARVTTVDVARSPEGAPHARRRRRPTKSGYMMPEGQWTCIQCTFINPPGSTKCEVCRFPDSLEDDGEGEGDDDDDDTESNAGTDSGSEGELDYLAPVPRPTGTAGRDVTRVATWNIWHKYGKWKTRQRLIVAEMRRINADVLCLQEVWDNDDGGVTQNQAAILANALGMQYRWYGEEPAKGIKCGNAILSHYPILSEHHIPLPFNDDENEHCVAVLVTLQHPQGILPVLVTHLNWRFEHSNTRYRQVMECLTFLQAHNGGSTLPAILTGDFNAHGLSREMQALRNVQNDAIGGPFRDVWTEGSNGALGYTWDNVNPHARQMDETDRRIDYIFVGRAAREGPLIARIAGVQLAGFAEPRDAEVWPSDHQAVVADLTFGPPTA